MRHTPATCFAKIDHTVSSLFLTVPTGSARFTLITDKHTTPGMVSPNATQTAKTTMGVVGGLWGFMGVRVPRPIGDGTSAQPGWGWQGRPAGRRSWHLSVIGAQPERGPSLHLGICDASSPYHLWYGSPERDTNRQNGYGGRWGFMGANVPSRSGDGWVGQTGVELGTSEIEAVVRQARTYRGGNGNRSRNRRVHHRGHRGHKG